MIAITGANGFIGNHLYQYLLTKGIRAKRITRNVENDSFAIGNISGETNWHKALKNIEVIIHCASVTHIYNQKSASMEELKKVNIEATRNLVEQASQKGVKRIIFISSIKVNGEVSPKNLKFTNKSIAKPQDPYAISKYLAEKIIKLNSKKGGLDFVIIRPPLVYGEYVKGNFLSLINLISKGIPLPLNCVNNSRSIIYVGNLVHFIYKCILNSNANGKTFLISDPNPISTPQLVKLISKNLRKKIFLFNFPTFLMIIICNILKKRKSLSSLIDSLEIDSTGSYRQLNIDAPFTTEEGIQKTVSWYLNKNK